MASVDLGVLVGIMSGCLSAGVVVGKLVWGQKDGSKHFEDFARETKQALSDISGKITSFVIHIARAEEVFPRVKLIEERLAVIESETQRVRKRIHASENALTKIMLRIDLNDRKAGRAASSSGTAGVSPSPLSNPVDDDDVDDE